ncbi:lactonase family protein [Saliphagus infecundisoli]|uniref:Lactonase family protein n=1 Tax=Saliphagus infecundisoli TaxID=1849069 RepID=A0ABD5QIN6_9EURY|nr:lactonase family protein [Saliphagus infecundisoli]
MAIDPTLAFVAASTDAGEDGVLGFRLEDGRLETTGAADGGSRPAFLAASPDGTRLYVANREGEDGRIVAYTIEERGTLSRLNAVPTGGGGTPCYCSVDPTGRCVLTAQYGGGTVSVLPIDGDGRLGGPTAVVDHEGSGPDADRQSEPHPHAFLAGPDGEYAYAPDLGADRVFVYALDPVAGRVEPADCGHVDVHPGAGPRHLAFDPTGRYAYVIGELDSTVTAFERDLDTGGLKPVAVASTLPEGFDGENAAADIHVHPTGEFLYGSNRGHDSIAVYELGGDGRPTLLGTEPTRGEWPRNFALDPAGEVLFAENADSDTIVAFAVGSDGALEATGEVTDCPSPVCLAFVTG